MSPHLILWLALTSASVGSATNLLDDQPYCALRYRRLCQGKGRHIACQFAMAGPGESCENYTEIEFSNDLKHFVTHYINRRRQRLAAGYERVRGGAQLPKPEVMMLVEWDRELAVLAQRLADQCNFVHDDCRATVRYPYAGQTVGEVKWRRTSDSDVLTAQRAIRRVLDAWWGERRRVTPRQLVAPFRLTAKGTVWGHFSQLAVWTLRAVGCGAVRHGVGYPRLLLVCDFSHTNMLGQRTISPGPLAPCPIHTLRRRRSSYPLLCAPVRQAHTTASDDGKDENEYYYNAYDDDDESFMMNTTIRFRTTETWRETSRRDIETTWKEAWREATPAWQDTTTRKVTTWEDTPTWQDTTTRRLTTWQDTPTWQDTTTRRVTTWEDSTIRRDTTWPDTPTWQDTTVRRRTTWKDTPSWQLTTRRSTRNDLMWRYSTRRNTILLKQVSYKMRSTMRDRHTHSDRRNTRTQTKVGLLDQLEHELEPNEPGQEDPHWNPRDSPRTRETYFGKLRENEESAKGNRRKSWLHSIVADDDPKAAKHWLPDNESEDYDYSVIGHHHSSPEGVHVYEPRLRWQQTRDRPRREGSVLKFWCHYKWGFLRSECTDLCLGWVELDQSNSTPFGDPLKRVLDFRHKSDSILLHHGLENEALPKCLASPVLSSHPHSNESHQFATSLICRRNSVGDSTHTTRSTMANFKSCKSNLKPGANALMISKPTKIFRHPPEKILLSKPSLTLDKDMEDQLFRDTGFKPSPRRKPTKS